MNRRRKILVTFAALVAIWMGTALVRSQLIARRIARELNIPADTSGMIVRHVAPHAEKPSVDVPLLPLLINPLTRNPKVYLMIGDSPSAEIEYHRFW